MEIVSRLLEEAKQQEKIMKKNQSVLSSTHAKVHHITVINIPCESTMYMYTVSYM